MKQLIFFTILILLSLTKLSAQSNTVATGGEATGSGGNASFTAGEVFYTYKSSSTASVTEGVQQAYPTIFFDANGGTGTMANQTIAYNTSANLIINTFTRTDYSFAGWATTSGGAVAYADGAIYTMSDVADVTLYANWVTVPDAPTNLVATPGDGQITITFTHGADGGSPITNYEYTLDGGTTWIPFGPAITGTTVTITGLTNGTLYTIQLRAVNAVGAGAASEEVTASPEATEQEWYVDADGDGFVGEPVLQSSRPQGGFLLSELEDAELQTGDCDDEDADISPATVWYKDVDDDGYSDGVTLEQCEQPEGYKLEAELTSLEVDCDDANPNTSPETSGDVEITYTGAYFTSTNNNSANVALSVTIKLPEGADVTQSQLRFLNRDNGQPISGWLNIGLMNSNDESTGTATYQYTVTLSSSEDARQITIGFEVGGNGGCFSRNKSEDDAVINVKKNVNDLVTGGGLLILNYSGGIKAADEGSKANFGFHAKYSKPQKKVLGSINIITRRTESGGVKVYQIKSNNLSSLTIISATSSNPAKATINGSAIIKDVTDPNNPISISGNATIQLVMADLGEPGTYDVLAVTVWNNTGGLWFSSNWNGVKTLEQQIENGNIQVDKSNGNIGNRPTMLTLQSSKPNSNMGQSVTFTATVNETDPNFNPTGYVVFYDNGSLLGYAQVNSAKKALFVTSALTSGTHEIKAYYRGDSKFAASVNQITQIVSGSGRANPDVKDYGMDLDYVNDGGFPRMTVLGNPAMGAFKIRVSGNGREPMVLRIFDTSGRMRREHADIMSGEIISTGIELESGVYMAELIQGAQRIVERVIKQ